MEDIKDVQFTEQDKQTLATLYKGGFENAKFLRKVFLKTVLTSEERLKLKAIQDNPAIVDVLSRVFLPKVTWDGVVTHNHNLFTLFSIDGVDFGYTHTMSKARYKMEKYLKAGIERLKGNEHTELSHFDADFPNLEFVPRKDLEENVIDWHAYNDTLDHMDKKIIAVLTLANSIKSEEEMKRIEENRKKNSSK
jgi:hypothetical protein